MSYLGILTLFEMLEFPNHENNDDLDFSEMTIKMILYSRINHVFILTACLTRSFTLSNEIFIFKKIQIFNIFTK